MNSGFGSPLGRIATIAAVLILAPTANGEQLAFPTAEGFGRYAKGGRGGDVYHVTNLEDSGPGSLRRGIQSADGPRTIVFDLSGNIRLRTPLVFDKSHLTVAGQTAPGDGITLCDATVHFNQSTDLIVRYIRVRHGDKTLQTGEELDGISTMNVSNSIFDHLSVSWAIDNNDHDQLDAVTFQWCIYALSLNDSLHPDGKHAMCASYLDQKGDLTLHHNVYATGRDRHPTLGASVEPIGIVDFRNNVIYNWTGTANFGSNTIFAINNYFKPGPESDPNKNPIAMKGRHPTKGSGYMEGNVFEGHPDWTEDNYAALDWERWLYPGSKYQYQGTLEDWKLDRPIDLEGNEPKTDSAEEAYEKVLQSAGASSPRDAVDERIVEDIRNGTGRVIDSQEEFGGFPALERGTPPRDADRDGMPDEWEIEKGLDPANPEDRNGDADGDGYTNLEEYLNEIVGEDSDS